MTLTELERLLKLITKLHHEVEPMNKEVGRDLGRAKDRIINIFYDQKGI